MNEQTIPHFCEFLNENYDYGFFDNHKVSKDKDKYKTIPVQEFAKNLTGFCYDVVAYCDNIFKTDCPHINTKLYYLETDNDERHAWFSFVIDNYVYVIETTGKGIIETYKNEEEMAMTFARAWSNNEHNVDIYTYTQPNIFGLSREEFKEHIMRTAEKVYRYYKGEVK